MSPYGSCNETAIMWRYNKETETCEEYDGCAATTGNNFNNKLDCDRKCVGPAVDCSAAMCMLYCQYGFVGDEKSCPTCKCYEPCDVNIISLMILLSVVAIMHCNIIDM